MAKHEEEKYDLNLLHPVSLSCITCDILTGTSNDFTFLFQGMREVDVITFH